MKVFKVTFRFNEMPWYTITGIEAKNKNDALTIATEQMIIECGANNQMKKPLVQEIR